MSKVYLALGTCMLVLSGCVHTTKARFARHYTLNAPTATVNQGRRTSHPGRTTLAIARIIVPEWLEGTSMYYRLDYRHDNRLSAYSQSDWVAPPATLLEPIIQHAIASSGSWQAVIGPGNPASSDASLHIHLDDFSQAFSQPQESAGVLDATVTLIDNHDNGVMAQKHFHIKIAAPAPDAQGGASALDKAGARFAMLVQRWLATTPNAVQGTPK